MIYSICFWGELFNYYIKGVLLVEQFPNSLSITLLGSAGGAAKAVLAILNQAIVNEKDPIYEVIKNVTFYLVDIKQKIGRIMTSCFQI